ncbi:MAG: GAF domain-containing protein [Chloroflexi bacterium]|nr:GAF domain-containing protein [Chloroflexota bacterium]
MSEGSVRVLVVASQLDVAQPWARALEKAGYQVDAVEGMSRAASQARTTFPDVMVLDGRCVAAGLEGFAALREAIPEAVWLVISPPGALPSVITLLRFDVADILIEPVTEEDLCDRVGRAVEQAHERREMARSRALVPLYQISQAFMHNLHLDDLLQRIVEMAVEATGAQRGSIMLIDEDRQELTVRAAVGMPPEVMAIARERVGRGIAGWVARTGAPLVINNEEDVPPFLRSSLRGGMAHSAVCLPLTIKGRIIGVINLTKTAGQPPFTRGDAELLSVLAGQAAIAIENARLFEEMERAYEDLRRLDEMKSEFINVAAHELRTPVAVILGYASLLTEHPPDENIGEYLQAILRSAQRLQKVTDDLLQLENLSNWQPGEGEMEIGPVLVQDLVEHIVAEFRVQAEELELSLEVSGRAEDVWVRADEAKTALILRNLLSNAMKFTPRGGRVVVFVEFSEEEVIVSVADTGPAIPPEKRRHIFQPFYQAEPALTRSHTGLGLGLSIARRLAELQEGRLWLEDREGFGAVFCLALPRAHKEPVDPRPVNYNI